MQLFAVSIWVRWFMSHGKSCCMCGHCVMNVEIKQPKAHCKKIQQQWMRESILSKAKDTHVCCSRVSHGHVAAHPHLFGNASASSVPFNQGEQAFSCTNKRKQAVHAGIMCLRYHVCGRTPASSQIRVKTGKLTVWSLCKSLSGSGCELWTHLLILTIDGKDIAPMIKALIKLLEHWIVFWGPASSGLSAKQ